MTPVQRSLILEDKLSLGFDQMIIIRLIEELEKVGIDPSTVKLSTNILPDGVGGVKLSHFTDVQVYSVQK
jgi:hypothetical protein